MVRTLLTGLLLAGYIAMCAKKPREGIAVIVNGEEIASSEVLQAAELIRESMVAAFPEKAVEGVTDDLLANAARQLIANRLLVSEADRLGIRADGASVDSAFNNLRNRAPDQASFDRELIKLGQTDSSLRTQIGEGIRLEKLMDSIFSGMRQIDSAQCRDFYERNSHAYAAPARIRASQIFFPFVDSTSEEQKRNIRAQAEQVRDKIRSGKDFAEYAKNYSRGPGALEGGDIGWFKKGDLRADLETPLASLKKGETSDIITTDAGLFLLKKTGEEVPAQLPFDEVYERIRYSLELRERNRIIGAHIDSLMAKARIEYLDTTLARHPPQEIPFSRDSVPAP